MELFDTLSRRRQMQVDRINKDELREIWQQITDNSFDSRLQIFFDMYVTLPTISLISLPNRFVCANVPPFWYDLIRVDKDADGHITEAEVKEVNTSIHVLHVFFLFACLVGCISVRIIWSISDD